MSEKILGIDFGTSESLACVYVDGEPITIPNSDGANPSGRTFPSYVACTDDGTIMVGEYARALSFSNKGKFITEIKKYLGTDKKFNINGKDYYPQMISAMILNKIKMDTELFLGGSITNAVIAVPAYFDDNQREAIKDAGRIVGLDALHLIDEPTAAVLANGMGLHGEDEINILIFDLGWSSLDVTVVQSGGEIFEVLSSIRNSNINGKEMDKVLFDYFMQEFENNYVSITDNEPTLNRLRHDILRIKCELSNADETDVKFPFFAVNDEGVPLSFDETMSRLKLEELFLPIIEKSGECIDQAVHDAGLTLDEIDDVILVGGSARMPMVRNYVENYIGKVVETGVDPMECVAIGASIADPIFANSTESFVIMDPVIPLSIGYVDKDITVVLIKRNSRVPFRVTKVFKTDYDNQTELKIDLVRGERLLAKNNVSLGSFVFSGISPAPKGVPKIEVTFEVDVVGILSVTALDMTTGKEQSITFSNIAEITQEELMSALQYAKESEIENLKIMKLARIKYDADLQIYAAKRLINDSILKNKLEINKISSIERLIFELEDAMASDYSVLIVLNTKKLKSILEEIDLS